MVIRAASASGRIGFLNLINTHTSQPFLSSSLSSSSSSWTPSLTSYSNHCFSKMNWFLPFHVPLPHNVLYMLLALLRRHAPLVYKILELRKLVLDFLAPPSYACNRRIVPFRQLQDAVIACGSLSKEICVARTITEAPRHILIPNKRLCRMNVKFCRAIVPHGLRLRVFGPGRIRVAPGTLCFGLLPDSNVAYPEDRCGPGGRSNMCERRSWDVVFHADAVNPNHYLLC